MIKGAQYISVAKQLWYSILFTQNQKPKTWTKLKLLRDSSGCIQQIKSLNIWKSGHVLCYSTQLSPSILVGIPSKVCNRSWTSRYRCMTYASSSLSTNFTSALESGVTFWKRWDDNKMLIWPICKCYMTVCSFFIRLTFSSKKRRYSLPNVPSGKADIWVRSNVDRRILGRSLETKFEHEVTVLK